MIDEEWDFVINSTSDPQIYDRNKEVWMVKDLFNDKSLEYCDVLTAMHDYPNVASMYLGDGHLSEIGAHVVGETLMKCIKDWYLQKNGLLKSNNGQF